MFVDSCESRKKLKFGNLHCARHACDLKLNDGFRLLLDLEFALTFSRHRGRAVNWKRRERLASSCSQAGSFSSDLCGHHFSLVISAGANASQDDANISLVAG